MQSQHRRVYNIIAIAETQVSSLTGASVLIEINLGYDMYEWFYQYCLQDMTSHLFPDVNTYMHNYIPWRYS